MRLVRRLVFYSRAVAACAAVLAAVAAPAPAQASVPASVLGAYAGYGRVSILQSIGQQLGHPLVFGSDYIPYAQGWSGLTNPDIERRWANSGFRMSYGLPMFPTTCVAGDPTCWNAGAAGQYNSYFRTVAQNLVNYGQGNAILRIGWEFNVPGAYSWYAAGFAGQFDQYWRHIVTTMRSVPGAHFVFAWNPNIGPAIRNLWAFWPGSSYVGAVGMDIYDEWWKSYPGPQQVWQNYLTEPDGLNWLVSFAAAKSKPICLPEWGLGTTTQPPGSGNVGGGDDPYFVDQIAGFISGHNVIEAGLWDYTGNLPNSTVNPNATAALISDFG
jgi:hypothetical protein